MDELLATDEPAVGQLDEFSGDTAPYAEYRRLVDEQAAVRRVGTLVARGLNRGRYSTARKRAFTRWSEA
jgi:hypothetical protein